VVTLLGAEIADIRKRISNDQASIVRAMPNTAIAFRESMTCLAGDNKHSEGLAVSKHIFDALGQTLVVDEHQIVPATALCACGVAVRSFANDLLSLQFFCRAIRAASQGGIEIGFHSEDALRLAAQTAKGAATLLLQTGNHPEQEVDKVTTPMGCTISGLNCMEHHGFSSAMIKGITHSADKAAQLYKAKKQKQNEFE
jgi:pyrroline-5-carboxylate reductase